MKIGVCLPTLSDREAAFRQTLAAYEATESEHSIDMAIVTDVRPLGDAWNQAAEDLDADCDYIHFAIDDALPTPGWIEGALEVALDRYTIACPRLVFPDGKLEYCGSMGFGQILGECPTGTPCRSSPLPFVSAAAWEEIGPFMPANYYVDDDWCWRAACRGYKVRVARDYEFMHLSLKDAGRVARSTHDKMMFLYRCMGEDAAGHPWLEVSDAA